MAGLFDEQANLYAAARPRYPETLISFVASLTPVRRRAWDVGTGSGQAATMLAQHYEQVVGTDISESQLRHATCKENVRYVHTPVSLSDNDIADILGGEDSLDLVTVAQALHWFDLESFYPLVKRVLKKPSGIFAAWCYTEPSVSDAVDSVFWEFYRESGPYWEPARKIVDDEYRHLPFPFNPVLDDGRGTGPISFDYKKDMNVDGFLTYISSMSVLQCARKQGVELFSESRQNAFKDAWGETVRTVTWPVFLRIGSVD